MLLLLHPIVFIFHPEGVSDLLKLPCYSKGTLLMFLDQLAEDSLLSDLI